MPIKKEYQPENGANLDEKETKLATFSTISFENICLGMKTDNSSSIHWLTHKLSGGKTMVAIVDDAHASFGYDKAKWLSLIPGSELDVSRMVMVQRDGFMFNK